jgi:thiol:disulfide interchange protein DsbC
MFKKSMSVIFTVAISVSVAVFSILPTANAEPKLDTQNIADIFKTKLGLQATHIKASAMPGLAEVFTENGLFYASFDGNFFIPGKLYSIKGGIVDHSEQSLTKIRLEGAKKFENSMIEYKAKDEKYVITAFTDITCGYCRLMHEQMEAYNDLGITVRYLAYPRSGLQDQSGAISKGFKDLRSIWCNDEPAQALTKAKAGGSIEQRICDAPVAQAFQFGRQIGVTGTPALILENGSLLPGYREPADLVKILAAL